MPVCRLTSAGGGASAAIVVLLAAFAALLIAAQDSRAAAPTAAPAAEAQRATALLRSPLEPLLPLDPLEVQLAADAADGAFDEFSLAAAALIAGGVRDRQVLAHYTRRIDFWADELARSGTVAGPPRQRARAILEFMHGRVLAGGYDENCTELDRLLREGRFNCVSSLTLFTVLCRRFAVPVIAVESPGHCFAVLVAGGERLAIEVTCADWFELSDKGRRLRQSRGRAAGAAGGRREGVAPQRELSDPALAAIVYYNRAVDLLRRDAFAAAVVADQMALRLDPASADARENLLATWNNWAIALSERGEHERSLAVLRHGLSADPSHAKLRRNLVAVSQRAAIRDAEQTP